MTPPRKILVIDNDLTTFEIIDRSFSSEFYIKSAMDSKSAKEIVSVLKPDLIILEVVLPGQDGIEFCRTIREIKDFRPFIIFITERNEEYTEVAAFQAGADDFIIKPVRERALCFKIRCMFSRIVVKNEKVSDKIEFNQFVLDRKTHTIYNSENKTRQILPRKEFELLHFLAANAYRFCSREELIERLWGNEVRVNPRIVDVHINKLRDKIGKEHINTMKGVGYKIETSQRHSR